MCLPPAWGCAALREGREEDGACLLGCTLGKVGAPQLPDPGREVEECLGQPSWAVQSAVPEPLPVEVRCLM